mgnify:CR=1 FL=1
MKIVVLDGYTENPGDLSWDALKELGEVTVYDRTSYEESPLIAERIGDAEIVIINKTPISKETIDKCPNMKLIAVLATGYNVVDYNYAKEKNIPIISSMGAGNKLDASKFEVADIYKTSVCPLAKVMRRELKKRGVKKLKVVYSKEEPIKPVEDMAISCRSNCICPPGAKHKCTERRAIPGSVAFVPSVVGLIIAGEVVKDLVKDC